MSNIAFVEMKYMKRNFLFIFCFWSIMVTGQDTFQNRYKDHSFKVDDYVYIGNDSLVISSTESYQLEKCRITIKDFSFSIDDGGMGFKSKKVLSEVQETSSGVSMYSIKGPYGDKWNVVKFSIDDLDVIGKFHARKEMQPVLSYTLFSKTKIDRSDISKIILEYLSIERPKIREYNLMEVDKYEISDQPLIAKFIKNTMKR